jgi:hypothetical protein
VSSGGLLVSLHNVEDSVMVMMKQALKLSPHRRCSGCFYFSPTVTRSRSVLKSAEYGSLMMERVPYKKMLPLAKNH